MSVAPMIAPSIGGLMLLLGGRRFIYSLLAIAGIVLLAAVWCGLTETRPPDRGARLDLVGRYAAVLRQRRTVGYAAINALGFGSLFAFIAVSSVVLIGRMGASVALFGLLFALTSGGILAGNWCNTLLARRDVRQELPLAVGLWLAPLAAIAASLFLAAGVERLLTFVPFIVLIGFCRGITSPNATHAALEPVPNHAGVASAMMGCGQMLVGALSGGLVAALFPLLGPLAVTLAMAGFNIAALVVWRAVERGR
jgi:DHA1 family bicyclomycin/chloramphenicol resistance-like MFS transporter